MQNLIFLGAGIFILLIFLFSIIVIRLRAMRDEINIDWYNLLDKLQYRQDLVPNLIETIRNFIEKNELSKYKDLIKNVIDTRAKAARTEILGSEKITLEYELSKLIEKLFALENEYINLKQSTNFMELKREFSDIRRDIENLNSNYNKKVRKHNDIRKRPYNFIPAVLLGYKKKKIFDFE